MRIPLDRNSRVPLYRQIEAFLREAILAGRLAPDSRLPATRKLARDLGLNRITVENAYGELAADSLIVSKMGSGTFVLAPPASSPHAITQGRSWPLWQRASEQRHRLDTGGRNPADPYPGV